jgi:sugar (pentulose or hexulose) kinase
MMNKAKIIAIFDIGKTNKKILLFDEGLKIVHQQEEKFRTMSDEDGFECDDIERIEAWIKSILSELIDNDNYDIRAVNFCTYGATLVFLDGEGKRLAPVYNYLKKVPVAIQNKLFDKYNGEYEFCRITASPQLGFLLNSGIQILWFKEQHPELFRKLKSILHFPQYLSFLLTGQVVSEPTSIGCHTFLWDFDKNEYHRWLKDEGIALPKPQHNTLTIKTEFKGKPLITGIGIHDSSASLIPYIKESRHNFILVSAGTWCINMNPFNHRPLTSEQLQKDCLAYLSIDKKPVKSSRLFMGHIHDVNVKYMCSFFNVSEDLYKSVMMNDCLLSNMLAQGEKERIFFREGIPPGYVDESVNLSQFADFSEAYHRLMYDLTLLNVESIKLISAPEDNIKYIYVSGGFARNVIFTRLLASFFPDKQVCTSEIDNSSALGAALVVWNNTNQKPPPKIELNMKKWEPLKGLVKI